MRIIQILKPGLFIYECVRVIILALIFVLQRNEAGQTVRMIYAASAALFPLMALFICLDTDRYKAYLPLLIAGKTIGIVLEALWFIINIQVTIAEAGGAIPVLVQFIVSGDLFALAVVLAILKDVQKQMKTQGTEIAPVSGQTTELIQTGG